MKSSANRGGYYPPRPRITPSSICRILHILRKPNSILLIIHVFRHLTGPQNKVSCLRWPVKRWVVLFLDVAPWPWKKNSKSLKKNTKHENLSDGLKLWRLSLLVENNSAIMRHEAARKNRFVLYRAGTWFKKNDWNFLHFKKISKVS